MRVYMHVCVAVKHSAFRAKPPAAFTRVRGATHKHADSQCWLSADAFMSNTHTKNTLPPRLLSLHLASVTPPAIQHPRPHPFSLHLLHSFTPPASLGLCFPSNLIRAPSNPGELTANYHSVTPSHALPSRFFCLFCPFLVLQEFDFLHQ